MTKFTQKQLKWMVKEGTAIDITNGNNETREKILSTEKWLDEVGYSSGIYGCNGRLLKGHETGRLYAITTNTSAIYIF